MYEMHAWINRPQVKRFKLHLREYNGNWYFVGSIPLELTQEKRNTIGQEYRDSKTYHSEAEAVQDAENHGFKMGVVYEV